MNYLALDDEKGVERHYALVKTGGSKKYCEDCALYKVCVVCYNFCKDYAHTIFGRGVEEDEIFVELKDED